MLFCTPFGVLMGTVNYFGDAGTLFSSPELQIAKYLAEGYNVANAPNIDERALQRHVIALLKTTPSVIVLGSSTILLMKSTNASTNSFMNHGVSGASLEDMIAIYQLYKSRGVLPKKIIMGIDPWIFNKNSGQLKWKTLEYAYTAFVLSEPMREQSSMHLDKFYQLFSPSYFQSSIKTLYAKLIRKEKIVLLPTKQRINNSLTRLVDGSISYGPKNQNLTVQEVEKRAKQDMVGGDTINLLEKYTHLSKKHRDLFDKFISQIISQNIDLTFVLIPYHPSLYTFMLTNNAYRMVTEFEQYIKGYAQQKKIKLMGSYDPARFNLDSNYFYDGMHVNEKGLEIVLKGSPSPHPREKSRYVQTAGSL